MFDNALFLLAHKRIIHTGEAALQFICIYADVGVVAFA